MPTSSKSLSPKNCPVCGASIWSSKWNLPPSVWKVYETHLQSNHPEFEKWARRSGLTYLLAIFPFLGFALAAAISSAPATASLLATLMFPTPLSVVIPVWFYHRRIKNGFHRSWLHEHHGQGSF